MHLDVKCHSMIRNFHSKYVVHHTTSCLAHPFTVVLTVALWSLLYI